MDESLTLDQARADVAELLYMQPGDLDDTADIRASGLGSVLILTLVERWREAGVQVSFRELTESGTLADWWTLLSARLPGDNHRPTMPAADQARWSARGRNQAKELQ